jgi:hypothetical protein
MQHSYNNSLWASAFVLIGAILFVSGKHSHTANAETSIKGNGFTMVTTPSGQGSDLLYVFDNQRQVMMIYDLPDPQNQTKIRPVASWYLPDMFTEARK